MQSSDRPRTAVVIGASLAGMLTAHVAARHFERVIVVDRGEPIHGLEPRKAVPQEKHVHLLLQRGKRVMEALLPGFLAELERRGAVVADASRDVRMFHGRWKRPFDTGIYTHYCSRGLIDHVVRERLRANPRIAFEPATRVIGLVTGVSGMVRGVTLEADGGGARTIDAELVIDAGGRGSQASRWLTALGYPEVRTSQVTARLGYGTRLYKKLRAYDDAWKVLLVLPRPPAARRMGVISPIEGDRWMVTTGGWLGDCPGEGEAEFLEFLRGLPDPAI
ncbi:MAG TPA: FAD-dependent oxidoreductase, partial [Kofleriaceae bacterium]